MDESKLDGVALKLKKAFDEKRIVQLFQPIISLMNEEQESEDEIHNVTLQHVGTDGSVKDADDTQSQITFPEFQKFVDRWILREIIGRLVNDQKDMYPFIIKISDASLADATFFNWLRKMMTGLDTRKPGKNIAIEIALKDLLALEKQTSALITFLKKT